MGAARGVPVRRRRAGERVAVASICVAALCAAATVPGCAEQRSAAPAIAPVDPHRAPTTASAVDPTAPPTSAPQPAGPDAPSSPGPEEIVHSVLTAYAAVLTELSADPAGAPAPGSASRQRWDEVVAPSSALSQEILARIHDRATVDHVVVQPGTDGVSYRHRLVAVDHAEHGAVEFSWCGWAPGVGRSLVDGGIVDDQVAHATGTGRVELDDGRWRLTRLDQLEVELLPAGAADPCQDGDGDGEGAGG